MIFDEARTRGSDIKMASNVLAALTVGPSMTQLKIMQSMGRLRGIEVGQRIKIFGTTEILQKIDGLSLGPNADLRDQIKAVVKWVTANSVKENEKFLYHNNRLAWLHFESLNRGMRPYIEQANPQLEAMYKSSLDEETPFRLNEKHIAKLQQSQKSILENETAKKQFRQLEKYGQHFTIKCQGFDDVCEREVEMVEEVEEEQEKEYCQVAALGENEIIRRTSMDNVTVLPFRFDPRLLVSYNFRNCTNRSGCRENNDEGQANKHNELMYANFVELSQQGLCLITQREANRLLQKSARYLNPRLEAEDAAYFENGHRCLVRYSDLGVGSKILQELRLREVFVQSMFFNGHEDFRKEGQSA